jgi:hypothetical protein
MRNTDKLLAQNSSKMIMEMMSSTIEKLEQKS